VHLARRWPDILSNVVDPGGCVHRMGDAAAMVSGGYWHDMRQEQRLPGRSRRASSSSYGRSASLNGRLIWAARTTESRRKMRKLMLTYGW
jgi:hypothetical protein